MNDAETVSAKSCVDRTRSSEPTHIVIRSGIGAHLPVSWLRRFRIKVFTVGSLVVLLITMCLVVRLHAMQPPPLLPFPYAFVPSPNCDDRPPGAVINCIVLHATVEPTTEGTMNIFLTPARRVSAHFVVGRDGRVVQMVPVEKRAWHAGSSVLENVGSVNNFSVGIEMVNLNDGIDPYTPEQMEAVAGIIRLIRSRYDVPDARIVSHAQVALPAGRKSDPVGFDFDKIRAMVRSVPASQPHLDGPAGALPAPAVPLPPTGKLPPTLSERRQ